MADRHAKAAVFCASLVIGLARAADAALASGCAPPVTVHFPAGASATDLNGGVPRGERDCYVLQARQGQTLAIAQPDPVDDNIVFQIYRPPWIIHRTGEEWAFGGAALPGAEETRDTSAWTGRLPASGRYLLVIGTSRGSGTYHLRIEIR